MERTCQVGLDNGSSVVLSWPRTTSHTHHPAHHPPCPPRLTSTLSPSRTPHSPQVTMLGKLAFLGVLLAMVPFALEFITRRAYPLPPPGGAAIVISGACTYTYTHACVALSVCLSVWAWVGLLDARVPLSLRPSTRLGRGVHVCNVCSPPTHPFTHNSHGHWLRRCRKPRRRLYGVRGRAQGEGR